MLIISKFRLMFYQNFFSSLTSAFILSAFLLWCYRESNILKEKEENINYAIEYYNTFGRKYLLNSNINNIFGGFGIVFGEGRKGRSREFLFSVLVEMRRGQPMIKKTAHWPLNHGKLKTGRFIRASRYRVQAFEKN